MEVEGQALAVVGDILLQVQAEHDPQLQFTLIFATYFHCITKSEAPFHSSPGTGVQWRRAMLAACFPGKPNIPVLMQGKATVADGEMRDASLRAAR